MEKSVGVRGTLSIQWGAPISLSVSSHSVQHICRHLILFGILLQGSVLEDFGGTCFPG